MKKNYKKYNLIYRRFRLRFKKRGINMNKLFNFFMNNEQTVEEKQQYDSAINSGRKFYWKVATRTCTFTYSPTEYYKALIIARATRNKVQAVFV